MAGIAGIRGIDNGELERILEKTKHRGPHGTWTNREQGVNLGGLELNVGGNCKDGSHQASDNQRAVVLDGRIYNSGKSSMTDAEAVLYFYDKFGTHFARKLDGDFACAVNETAS